MMAKKILAVLLAACLFLSGCRNEAPVPEPPPDPPAAADPAPDVPPPEEHQSIILERLTVEVVVDWEDTDRMLGSLDQLARLLEAALASFDCTIEEPVTITLGTAGGITAQALSDGGVDAAFLPAKDLSKLEDGKAVTVLESSDQTLAAAVTEKSADQQRFCAALAQALTETEEGREFAALCYPGTVFSPVEQSVPGD